MSMARKAAKPARISATPRAWQRMLSGRRLEILDPSPLDVELDDIAHGIARVARWNGQTMAMMKIAKTTGASTGRAR